MKERFYFDMHVHFPRKPENVSTMLELAIERGLDAVGYVAQHDFGGSLRQVLIKSPEVIRIHGRTNTLQETIKWNLDSLRQNGFGKIRDTLEAFRTN